MNCVANVDSLEWPPRKSSKGVNEGAFGGEKILQSYKKDYKSDSESVMRTLARIEQFDQQEQWLKHW